MKTTYGGKTWTSQVYPEENVFISCINFLDPPYENEAWCSLGSRNMFLYSRDGGSSWFEVPTPSQTFVTSLSFPDSRHGYASGTKGEILKYTKSSNGIMPVGSDSKDDKLSLNEICDILGREVASVINQAMTAGDHEVILNPQGLPAGIYFCSLAAPSFPASTMRLVIAK